MMVIEPTKVGIGVTCTVCGGVKDPVGRSLMFSGCNRDCKGYRYDPKPGDLFPGETDADFGYPSCSHATRPMTAEEIAKWKEKEASDAE